MLASQHFVERLLESFAALGFRPERLVIINDAVRISTGLAGVTDNLAGHFSIRINTHIDRAHNNPGRRIIFDLFVLQLAKILRDLHRHDSPVMVMTKDRFIGNLKFATNQPGGPVDLFPGEAEHLRVGKIKRRREIDGEIVAEPILRERLAIAVCDLAARCRNVEDVSAREFLRLKGGLDCFLFSLRSGAEARHSRWRERLGKQ